VLLFREIGRLVLDPSVSDGQLRQTIYRHVPADKLLAAVEECDQLVRPLDDSYFDFLARRCSHIREFTTWYLREETLQPAIASIVNHHYRHPLARLWGGDTLSSSDGQRFSGSGSFADCDRDPAITTALALD